MSLLTSDFTVVEARVLASLPSLLPRTPPETRGQWERLLRTVGCTEVRAAKHGALWTTPTGRTFQLPRLTGNAKRLDPRCRLNLLAQLRRALA